MVLVLYSSQVSSLIKRLSWWKVELTISIPISANQSKLAKTEKKICTFGRTKAVTNRRPQNSKVWLSCFIQSYTRTTIRYGDERHGVMVSLLLSNCEKLLGREESSDEFNSIEWIPSNRKEKRLQKRIWSISYCSLLIHIWFRLKNNK